MEDEKVIISLEAYEDFYRQKLELQNLLSTIFEFASLNYSSDNLSLNEVEIINWLKVNYKTAYNSKIELLKKRKEEENDK